MLSVNQELQGGRYRILSQFGQGDAGVSYQAFDNVLQTKVIIKETHADQPNLYKNSITRQLDHISSIKHDAFTQVHGYFSEVDRQYLVTESTEGKSLKELLDRSQKPFPLFEVLLWTEQTLNALNYLHSKAPPIIHCGITPINLILTENKRIKLLTSAIIKDFGVKQTDELKLPYLSLELLWETLDSASQKVILNSYDVESAEILESPIDERSSVYALGATIYHLVTGKVPVNALERSIELLDGKDDPLVNPSNLNSQVPRNFSVFLIKSLELKRENRFASMSSMRTALQPMLDLMQRIQSERQKEAPTPEAKAETQAIREAALREVELARQVLKKQREEEALKKAQAEQAAIQLQTEAVVVEEKIEEIETPVFASPVIEQVEEVVAKTETIEVERPLASQITEIPIISQPVVIAPQIKEESITQTVAVAEDESDLFASHQVERKKPFWLIPAICAVVILVVGGFFGIQLLNSGSAQNTAPKISENADSPKTESPAATQITSQTVEQSTSEAAKTEETTPVLPNETKPNTKKSTAPVQAAEKKPATAKTPVPKKKEVSVDDIINDN